MIAAQGDLAMSAEGGLDNAKAFLPQMAISSLTPTI